MNILTNVVKVSGTAVLVAGAVAGIAAVAVVAMMAEATLIAFDVARQTVRAVGEVPVTQHEVRP